MNLHYSKTYLLRHTATYCFTTLWIYTTPKLNFDLLHWCELFYYPAILHLFKCSNKHLKLLPAQNARNYTTPKPQKKAFRVATSVCITEHSIAFYYITSLLSEKHIECHACANLFNYPAILHLFKCSNRHLKLLLAQKSRKYTTPKLWDGYWRITSVLLPYEFTLLQNCILNIHFFVLSFTTLWIYTTPKPQKRTEAATSVCITGYSIIFYYITSLFLEKTYWLPYLCKFVQLPCDFAPLQTLKETSEVATGTKCTQLHYSKTGMRFFGTKKQFYCPMNLHYSKTTVMWCSYFASSFTALWIYTTPKPQKRIFEAATSACITGLSIASYHIAFLLSKTYWLPYLCKFVQLPCNFAPLQMLK